MNFIPVLMGNDINVYSMARAFHQAYGKTSYVLCKSQSGPCADSKIIQLKVHSKMDTSEIFLKNINEYAQANQDKIILLVGCGDSYVEVISSNLDKLPKNVIAPYMNFDKIRPLTDKETFYQICEEHGIDYPKTFVMKFDTDRNEEFGFIPPYIIKPADSVSYWEYPFDGQDKVFLVDTKDQLNVIIDKIFDSGYPDSIIVQEFVPGDDTNMRVMTCYSDQNAKVKMMCLGHVLLEEHTPKGIGNHAVILNEYNQELYQKFAKLLEALEYTGFSNFDVKYDPRDGKYKAFEINPRQGRSNYYVTHSGENLAKILVEEFIEKKPIEELKMVNTQKLWMVVPKKVAFKYIKGENYQNEMKDLIKSGNFVNPLYYDKDKGIIRMLKLYKSQLSHFAKYKKYLGGK